VGGNGNVVSQYNGESGEKLAQAWRLWLAALKWRKAGVMAIGCNVA